MEEKQNGSESVREGEYTWMAAMFWAAHTAPMYSPADTSHGCHKHSHTNKCSPKPTTTTKGKYSVNITGEGNRGGMGWGWGSSGAVGPNW